MKKSVAYLRLTLGLAQIFFATVTVIAYSLQASEPLILSLAVVTCSFIFGSWLFFRRGKEHSPPQRRED